MSKQRINPITGKPMLSNKRASGVSNIQETTGAAIPETDEYAYLRNEAGDQLIDISEKRGLDVGHGMYGNIARDQSTLEQIGIAATNLVPNMAAGIIETVGYLGELVRMPFLEKSERDFSNYMTRWAESKHNKFGTIFGMSDQIYLENPEKVFDMSDGAWWVTHGSGLFESIGEFAATGAGVGKVLGSATKALARSTKLANRTIGFGKATMTGEQLAAVAAQTGTSATLSYAEGAMSGSQVYKQVYERAISQPGVTEDAAKQLAAEAAAKTVGLNTAINTALNFTPVGLFVKGDKALHSSIRRIAGESTSAYRERLRGIMQNGINPSMRNTLVNLSKEGAQEALEELTNVVSERRGLLKPDESESLLDSYGEAFMSEEGVLSMILGAIGGIGQTAVTQNIPMFKNTKGKRMSANMISRYNAKKYATNLVSDLDNIEEAKAELAVGIAENNPKKIREAKNKMFSVAALRSIESGASSELVTTFEEMLAVDNNVLLGEAMSAELEQLNKKLNTLTGGQAVSEEVLKTLDEDTQSQVTALVEQIKSLETKITQEGHMTAAMKAGLAESAKDNEYQILANEAIAAIPKLEALYNQAQSYENSREVYYAFAAKEELKSTLKFVKEEQEEFNNLLSEFSDDSGLSSQNPLEVIKVLNGELPVPEGQEEFYKELRAQAPELVSSAKEISKSMQNTKDAIKEVNKKIKILTSKKEQAKLKKIREEHEEVRELIDMPREQRNKKLESDKTDDKTKELIGRINQHEDDAKRREKLDAEIKDVVKSQLSSTPLTEAQQTTYNENKDLIDERVKLIREYEQAKSNDFVTNESKDSDTDAEANNVSDDNISEDHISDAYEQEIASIMDEAKAEQGEATTPDNETNQLLPNIGWNLVSWLSRDKRDKYDERTGTYYIEETSDNLSNSPNNHWLLDHTVYKPGKKLIARIPEDKDNIPVYTDFSARTTEKFGDLGYEENSRDYIENVPIQLVDPDNGQVVGYIHAVGWIRSGTLPGERMAVRTSYEDRLAQVKQLTNLRQQILAGNTDMAITSRTEGYPFRAKDNKSVRTSAGMGRPSEGHYKFTVGSSDGQLIQGRTPAGKSDYSKRQLRNKKITPGQVYVLPSDTNTAYPVRVTTVGQHLGVMSHIKNVMKVWALISRINTTDTKIAKLKEHGLYDMYNLILNEFNLDISSDEGMQAYLRRFIYTPRKKLPMSAGQYVYLSNEGSKSGKSPAAPGRSMVGVDANGLMMVMPAADKATGKRGATHTINPRGDDTTNLEKIERAVDQVVANMYFHINKDLLNGGKFKFIDKDGNLTSGVEYGDFLASITETNILAPKSKVLGRRVWNIQSKVQVDLSSEIEVPELPEESNEPIDFDEITNAEAAEIAEESKPKAPKAERFEEPSETEKEIDAALEDAINSAFEEYEESEEDEEYNSLLLPFQQERLVDDLEGSAFVIKDVPPAVTQHVVNRFVHTIVDILLREQNGRTIPKNKILQIATDSMTSRLRAISFDPNLDAETKEYIRILNVDILKGGDSVLVRKAGKQLANTAGFRIRSKKVNDENVLELEAVNPDQSAEEFTEYDAVSMEKDAKNSASLRAKFFLLGLRTGRRIFDSDKSMDEYADYNEVYNKLMGILAGTEPDAKAVYDKLLAAKESDPNGQRYPWIDDLIKKLKSTVAAEKALKKNGSLTDAQAFAYRNSANLKSLLSLISRDRLVMQKPIMSRKKVAGGTTSELRRYRLQEVNTLMNTKQIRNRWDANLRSAVPAITKRKASGNVVYDKDVIEQLVGKDSIDENGHTQLQRLMLFNDNPVEISEFLNNMLGLEINPETVSLMLDKSTTASHSYMRKTYKQVVSENVDWFKILQQNLQSIIDRKEDISVEESIFADSRFSAIARTEGITSDYVPASSFIDNSKMLASYVEKKAAIQKAQDILRSDETLNDLNGTHFGSNHPMVSHLLSDKNRADNFALDHLPIGAFTESGRRLGKLTTLSHKQHELAKLTLWLSAPATANYRSYLYQSMSDKQTQFVLKLPKTDNVMPNTTVDLNGTLTRGSLLDLYNYLVRPEAKRAINHNNVDIKGYNNSAFIFHMLPDINNVEDLYTKSGLNMKYFDTDGNLTERGEEVILPVILEHFNTLVENKYDEWTNPSRFNLVYDKKNNPDGINFRDFKVEGETVGATINRLARDYVADQLRANASIQALFVGDPAIYHKSDTFKSLVKSLPEDSPNTALDAWKYATDLERDVIIKQIWSNQSKRLASEMAAGSQGADWHKSSHVQLFLNDRESESASLEYLKTLGLSGLADYKSIEGTDAQEFITWQEHLWILESRGFIGDGSVIKISDVQEVRKILESGISFTKLNKSQLSKIKQVMFGPMKPVQVATDYKLGIARRTYIKSSTIPLIPQLTKGKQIDKLRLAMESIQDEYQAQDKSITGVRAAFSSAVKVGNTTEPYDIWEPEYLDDKGNVTEEETDNVRQSNRIKSDLSGLADKARVISKKNMYIQQEIPYKASKKEIATVTQARKMLFVDMLDSKFDDETKGRDLYFEYSRMWDRLFEIAANDLDERLSKDGEIEALLRESADDRSLMQNELDALTYDDGDFEIPLWASPSYYRNEQMLMSVYNSTIVKQSMPGQSAVLVSEEGFADDPASNDTSRIIYTSAYNGEHLMPARVEDGVYKPAQVFLPSKFRDGKGKLINLFAKDKNGYKYVTVEGNKFMLKEDMFDADTLKMLGFRIPNQGHASMSSMEIAGFLPPEMGNIVVAPRDFTKQMGSDFDVDKLYMYSYNNSLDEDGRIIRNSDTEKFDLQNKIQDMMHKVLQHPDAQKKMFEPLSFGYWKFNDGRYAPDNRYKDQINDQGLAGFFAGLQPKSEKFSPMSGTYQRDKFIDSTSGKGGIGVFSLDATFNSMMQASNLKWGRTVKDAAGTEVFKPHYMRFGNLVADGSKFTDPKTIRGDRDKSDVILGIQSASVDNENEQILGKINVNPSTFPVVTALQFLGFEEDIIGALLNQPIIREYVTRLRNEGISNEDAILDDLYTASGVVDEETTSRATKLADFNGQDAFTVMIEMIERQDDLTDVDQLTQAGLLRKFMRLKDLGDDIRDAQKLLSVDSGGISGTFTSAKVYTDEIHEALYSRSGLVGLHTMIVTEDKDGNVVNTVAGSAIIHGLTKAYSDNRKYTFTGTFESSIDALIKDWYDITGRVFSDSLTSRINKTELLVQHMRSSVFSHPDIGIYPGTPRARRERLMYSQTYENSEGKKLMYSDSLATWLKRATKKLDNKFLRTLEFEMNTGDSNSVRYKKEPDMIKYNASRREDDIEYLFADFVNLYVENPTIDEPFMISPTEYLPSMSGRDLVEQMIEYFYLTGAYQQAIQFSKMIPVAYLKESGFAASLRDMSDVRNNPEIRQEVKDYFRAIGPNSFIEQYLQNNPTEARKLSRSNIDDLSYIYGGVNPESIFKLSDEYEEKQGDQKSPEYVHRVLDNGEVALYRLMSVDDPIVKKVKGINPFITYKRIPLRGSPNNRRLASLYREYEIGAKNEFGIDPQSIFNPNTGKAVPFFTPVAKGADTRTKRTTNREEFRGSDARDKLVDMIVENAKDPIQQSLAYIVMEALPYVEHNRFNKLVIDPDYTQAGKYSRTTGTITVHEGATKDSTLLEEAVHVVTAKMLSQAKDSGENVAEFKYLEELRQKLITKHKATYDSLMRKAKLSKTQQVKLTQAETNVRGLENLVEFVHAVMTDPFIQRELSLIPDTSNKSMLDSILSKVIKIVTDQLEKLGIPISGSVKPALYAAYKIMSTDIINNTVDSDTVTGSAAMIEAINKPNDSEAEFNRLESNLSALPLSTKGKAKLKQLIADGIIERQCD